MDILCDWDSGKAASIPGVRDHERMRSEGDAPEQSVIFNYGTYVDTHLPGHSEGIVRHFKLAFKRLKEAHREIFAGQNETPDQGRDTRVFGLL
ncbi:hypothetical protein MAP00_000897 [Monascus purpureus]|nr:hypothetical protein MAP00_000897 [Monascus purpureus]